jgi:hypothetical protein
MTRTSSPSGNTPRTPTSSRKTCRGRSTRTEEDRERDGSGRFDRRPLGAGGRRPRSSTERTDPGAGANSLGELTNSVCDATHCDLVLGGRWKFDSAAGDRRLRPSDRRRRVHCAELLLARIRFGRSLFRRRGVRRSAVHRGRIIRCGRARRDQRWTILYRCPSTWHIPGNQGFSATKREGPPCQSRSTVVEVKVTVGELTECSMDLVDPTTAQTMKARRRIFLARQTSRTAGIRPQKGSIGRASGGG